MAMEDSDTYGWPKKRYIYRPVEDDVPGWPFGPEKRRILDVFDTNYGTKIFVENGLLVEEKISPQPPPSQLCPPCAPVGYSPGVPYDESTKSVEKRAVDLSQTIKTAKSALVYYNYKHNTDYVLVDPINSNAFIRTGNIWYHSSFTAKSEKSSEPSTILFFAELKVVGFECKAATYEIITCRPLDERKTVDHCEICSKGLLPHPKSKFRQGCYKSNARVLRPRSNGKVMKKRAVDNSGY